MSVLFAVKSCQADQLACFHDAIWNTWGHSVPKIAFDIPTWDLSSSPIHGMTFSMRWGDLLFFVGGNSQPGTHDVLLSCPDGYTDLPYKVREIMRYFLGTEHDFVFLCDTDTFVIPKRLLNCGYEKYDITAAFIKGMKPGQIFRHVVRDPRGPDIVLERSFAPPSGGLGYFLSRKAAQIIADTEPDPKIWADDLYVAEALGPMLASGELTGYQPPDYHDMTFHFPKHQYKTNYSLGAKWMERMYRQYTGDFPKD